MKRITLCITFCIAGCGADKEISSIAQSLQNLAKDIPISATPTPVTTPIPQDNSGFVGNWIDVNNNSFQFNQDGSGIFNGETFIYTIDASVNIALTMPNSTYICSFSNTNTFGPASIYNCPTSFDILMGATLSLFCNDSMTFNLNRVFDPQNCYTNSAL